MNAIDAHLGLAPDVLLIRSRRFELIANNLANADTPGYKARDIDFGEALSRARADAGRLARTDPAHMRGSGGEENFAVKYRVPEQTSLDGNTVETAREHAAFMDNAIRYQASLSFLDGRIKSIRSALRTE